MYNTIMNRFIKIRILLIKEDNMPKIIENLREELLAEAKKQIAERGYRNTTIRSVAAECGIAVGTVYNYFKSKDMLIASFILVDWLECVRSIASRPKEDRREYLAFIHLSLCKFQEKYRTLFTDEDAMVAFSSAFNERHGQLRAQLADLIMPIADERFTAEFVAEAMLTWTTGGKTFDEIYTLLPEKIK